MVDFGDDIAGYIMHDSGHHGSAAGILLKENTVSYICYYSGTSDGSNTIDLSNFNFSSREFHAK
jgi:hypothetical protein